jgi:hypothetical protein
MAQVGADMLGVLFSTLGHLSTWEVNVTSHVLCLKVDRRAVGERNDQGFLMILTTVYRPTTTQPSTLTLHAQWFLGSLTSRPGSILALLALDGDPVPARHNFDSRGGEAPERCLNFLVSFDLSSPLKLFLLTVFWGFPDGMLISYRRFGF